MKEPVKVGIVGIGGYGRFLLDLLLAAQEEGRALVEAAVVINPDADLESLQMLEARAPQTQILSSWNELLATGTVLDLAVLPVGIPAHRELAVAALEAGWNVLVEKPLAGSVEEGLQIVDAARRSGKFAAVGFQNMYETFICAMKTAILAGEIGEVRRIKVFALSGRSEEYYSRNNWAGKLHLKQTAVFDSPFNNGFAHFLNIALFLAGKATGSLATPLFAESALFRAHAIASCDTATVRWQLDSGVEAGIYFSHLGSAHLSPELIVEGTRGSIFWQAGQDWELRIKGRPVSTHRADGANARKEMVRRVLNKVRVPEEPVFTVEQAMSQVRAVALAHASTSIQEIPASAVERRTIFDGQTATHWIEVPGLEVTLRGAFENNRRLNRADFLSVAAPVPAAAND